MLKFFRNVSMSALASVLLKIIGMYFTVFLSRSVGSETIGIYSLTMSVIRLGITFASFGISFALTRIVAEEREKGNTFLCRKYAEKCLLFSLLAGIIALLVFLIFADFFGGVLLQEKGTVLSIRVLSISLPFIVMSFVIQGFFTAIRRIESNVIAIVSAELIRVGLSLIFVLSGRFVTPYEMCFAICLAGVISDIISFAISYLFYINSISGMSGGVRSHEGMNKRLFGIALPVAISSYIRSGLLTVEHMLIPSGLRKYGENSTRAMSLYGVVTGMAFPVIFFPTAFLYSATDLIMPEFASCFATGNKARAKRLANKSLSLTLYFSVGIAGIFSGFADEFGRILFKNDDAGLYIFLLAPLCIFMYTDHLADGILKGLNLQVDVVRYNIIDSVISVILVMLLLPKMGIMGYVLVVWLGEVLNAMLSVGKLLKVTEVGLKPFSNIVIPSICVLLSVYLSRKCICLPDSVITLGISVFASILIYLLLLRITKRITNHDYVLFVSAFRRNENH